MVYASMVRLRRLGLARTAWALESKRAWNQDESQSEPTHDDRGIDLQLQGVVGAIRSGPHEFLGQSERRLTAFDELWQSRELAALFAIVVWIFPTMIGGIRLYKELAG